MHHFRNIEFIGGGFVCGIIAHPKVAGLWLARTDVGGAYRFDAAADRWIPLTDWIDHEHWRYTGVESIAVDPGDAARVYLALGIYNREDVGNGAIARSNDGGKTFELTPMPFGMGGNEAGRGSGERLAVDPDDGARLLFGSRDAGLWQSRDHGETWSRVETFPRIETRAPLRHTNPWHPSNQAVGIVFVLFGSKAPGAPRAIYVGVSVAQDGLWRSLDCGKSWHAIRDQPRGLLPIRAALGRNGRLFITYGNEPGPNTMTDGAVHRFDPTDGTFSNTTPLAPEPEVGRGFGHAGVAVSATNPEHVMVTTTCRHHGGGDELFRSIDGGQTWTAMGQRGTRDVGPAPWLRFGRPSAHVGHWMYALVIDPHDPNRALFATGQTVWCCEHLLGVDAGETPRFTVKARGIEETVPLSLASPPRGADVLVGVGDISGFVVFDADQPGPHLQMLQPTFKNTSSIDFAEERPELIVRVGNRGWDRATDVSVAAFSLDAGRNFEPCGSVPPGAEEGDVAVSADGSAWLWAPRAADTYISLDRGYSWTRSKGLEDDATLRVLSDRVSQNVFYAFSPKRSRAWLSEDAGRSFRPTAQEPPGPYRDGCAVFGSAGQLYAVFGTRLYRSRDGARSWEPCLGLSSATHVAVGRPAPGKTEPVVFAAGTLDGERGFFMSSDSASSWSRINDDAHQFGQLRKLCGDPKRYGRCYLATGGRGVLVADLKPPRAN